ncbi:hypothetical protein ASPFODRAFT_54556 [Aspergillus luchuensis CBS 106.47]|uniref:Uncharacterized protein n=1 Tax=Aspergillus luchuensis (strain CBS 106.47) TaxID=1137211 RepID=A0A1M3SZ91_ASPLC|nr:hypothetical protein ASPFODRAFT_54556 [Aspergillus luchuensis CBS 106.47]
MAVTFWYVGQNPAYRKYLPTNHLSSFANYLRRNIYWAVLQLWITRRPSDSIGIKHAGSASEGGRVRACSGC